MADIHTLSIPQRFDFGYHKVFTQEYEKYIEDPQCRKIYMDFSRTEYLDSSALGMMVLLNKKASAANKVVAIKGAKDNSLDILKIANFDKLFAIE